jgi:carbonic anhydrase
MMNGTWTVKMMARHGESFGFLSMTDLNGIGPLNYVCTQFHFHSPAEHKINGKQYDLELHFVHEIAENEE